jgi:hypothetical protein
MSETESPRSAGVTMMLADAAQVQGGKLFILGGGWNITNAQSPSAIALIFEIPWSETNRRHAFGLELVDADGHGVGIGAEGNPPFEFRSEFEIGRPPGSTPGVSFNVPFALNLAPLGLRDGRYEWRCSLNGQSRLEWRLPFEVRGGVPTVPPSLE